MLGAVAIAGRMRRAFRGEQAMTIRDFLENALFYTQEILMDANTPGAVAKERLVRNVKLLKEACECCALGCHLDPAVLMKETQTVQAKKKGPK
jgi:hypothetical protein